MVLKIATEAITRHPDEAQTDFAEAGFISHNGELKIYEYFVLSLPYLKKTFTQIYSD